jgi:hypothetical protein
MFHELNRHISVDVTLKDDHVLYFIHTPSVMFFHSPNELVVVLEGVVAYQNVKKSVNVFSVILRSTPPLV